MIDITDFLYNIDVSLFRFFNSTIANPVFDFIMPILTNEQYWLPVYIIGLILLIWKGGIKGRLTALTLILTVIISDQISSSFLKEIIGRIRPCHTLDNVHLLVGCGGGKSFPSSHAVNNFAAAMVIFKFFPQKKYLFFSIAGIVTFTRVYCGVHYPSDLLGGTVIGLFIGWSVAYLIQYIYNKKYPAKPKF